jgi:2-polyprenyl-3-methyl-5-hydroxy-6-metoxy-1,4-benzoquinol methylase
VRDPRLERFVLAELPSLPARVLEVGCGGGELALAMDTAGYAVTAIDPEAPAGEIFERVGLEDFATEERFDAVVSSVALHHIPDLEAAVERIATLLAPQGRLVLSEFDRDRFLEEATARWYHRQLLALPAARHERDAEPIPEDFAEWRRATAEHLADIHSADTMLEQLARSFVQRSFTRTPYLYRYELSEAIEPLERELIDLGAIQATGFRYVGELR